jgi:hypothetical protein
LGRHETINAIRVLVKGIESQFVLHVQQNQNTTRQPDRQTGNVDQGIAGIFLQIAQRDFEVVFEHGKVKSEVFCPRSEVTKIVLAFLWK